jgi:PilZ domain-containing protein
VWRQSLARRTLFSASFMYKFIVSCYYWPAGARGLRLRTSIIKEQFSETGSGFLFADLGRLTSLDNLASSIERRRMRRLKVRCEVELMATLTLLDNDVQSCDSSLVFLGRTHDLSASGVGMVLPSTIIDERFCSGANRLNLSLHVPDGVIDMEVSPVRCERLSGAYASTGYLLGTKITNVEDRAKFERYLESVSRSNHRLHRSNP